MWTLLLWTETRNLKMSLYSPFLSLSCILSHIVFNTSATVSKGINIFIFAITSLYEMTLFLSWQTKPNYWSFHYTRNDVTICIKHLPNDNIFLGSFFSFSHCNYCHLMQISITNHQEHGNGSDHVCVCQFICLFANTSSEPLITISVYFWCIYFFDILSVYLIDCFVPLCSSAPQATSSSIFPLLVSVRLIHPVAPVPRFTVTAWPLTSVDCDVASHCVVFLTATTNSA